MKFDRRNVIFLGIFVVFFGCLLFIGEPIYTNDTFQYESQMVMREPGYALFMQLMRFISPEGCYQLIIVLQNILAVVANTIFMVFMRRRLRLGMPMSLLFTAILLAPHVMTPVFSHTHLILTNTLMTEGVLFSLYPLAMISLLDAIWDKKPLGVASIRTILVFFLLSLIRGQMMVLFVVWVLVMGILSFFDGSSHWGRSHNKVITTGIVQSITLFLIVVMAFVARSGLVCFYNYLENGLLVGSVSGKAMSFANVLYVADREDGASIEDERLRELFYEMYDTADADGMNYKYAPGGILNRAAHHEMCHDELNFTYFGEPAKWYVNETKGIYVGQYQELMIEIDKVAAQLSAELMPQVFGRYVKNYLCVIALGFVRTIAYEKSFLVWYAVVAYIAAIVLTVLCWRKHPNSMAAPFLAVILLTIVGNVCATALMIQCISRYMIYNLPLFYMAGLTGLLELNQLRGRSN